MITSEDTSMPPRQQKGNEQRAASAGPGDAAGHAHLYRRERRRRPLAWWLAGGLLLAAAFAVIAFLWQAGLIVEKKKRPPRVKVTVTDEGTILVKSTRISGLDEEELPFELRARISRRLEKNPRIIHLREVQGRFTRRNGDRILFRADYADYDHVNEVATLRGNVVIRSPGRYVLTTDLATVKVRNKEFATDHPVRMVLSDGTIRAGGGMRTTRNSQRVFFRGRVYATFGNESGNGATEAGKASRKNAGDDAGR